LIGDDLRLINDMELGRIKLDNERTEEKRRGVD